MSRLGRPQSLRSRRQTFQRREPSSDNRSTMSPISRHFRTWDLCRPLRGLVIFFGAGGPSALSFFSGHQFGPWRQFAPGAAFLEHGFRCSKQCTWNHITRHISSADKPGRPIVCSSTTIEGLASSGQFMTALVSTQRVLHGTLARALNPTG